MQAEDQSELALSLVFNFYGKVEFRHIERVGGGTGKIGPARCMERGYLFTLSFGLATTGSMPRFPGALRLLLGCTSSMQTEFPWIVTRL